MVEGCVEEGVSLFVDDVVFGFGSWVLMEECSCGVMFVNVDIWLD